MRFTCSFKRPDGDAIEFGEVAVEDDPLVAEDQDPRFDGYGEWSTGVLGMELTEYLSWLEVAICDLKIKR